ncbi:hypothetical protein JY651_24150 [Pyxidicoccus parkwayensis]|uniref:Lipoprotein n=1 Tax=Pyxidicoccus parkwayensis TaxID=2813578 RepID=A0ABX7PB99_9BACT|nr:hypothetical protein [Pyxidicoccus parkwaysis]QSQ27803.1 hypothetical protein JY651_24150 [Pyxidicoccus parkwaysis]
MKRLMLLSALALAGCYTEDTQQPKGVATFDVQVKGLYVANSNPRTAVSVVNACATKYGSQAQVPAEVRGTEECRYVIPRAPVDIDVDVTAIDVKGQPMESFNGPVSFRVVPGNLTGAYSYRWTKLTNGKGSGTVRASQLYGELHVWVEDEPPEVDYSQGQVAAGDLPEEPPTRSYATGLSKSQFFEEPTLATVQTPQNGDQLTAYSGTYMRIGRNPESGSVLRQNCEAGDPNNNEPVTLLVTGMDPGGFFVTDLTACRVKEGIQGGNTQTAEPDGYYPGRFNSIYIYNYSFPEGIDPGDLLWTVAGSVQEFTATTQLTFPSWSVREHVRLLPQAEWDKYLKLAPPVEINGRRCGYSSTLYITDPLCGYSYGNYKMESLESSLVKVRRVRFPEMFQSCDANGNGTVPFFCPNPSAGTWGACGTDTPGDPDVPERQCNIDCTLGIGQFAGKLCAEKNTYDSFGQFVVEMNPSGAAEAGLDASVAGRVQSIVATVDGNPDTVNWVSSKALTPEYNVNVWCDKAAFLRFGDTSLPNTANTPLAAQTRLTQKLTATQTNMWVSAQDESKGTVTCKVGVDARTRINLVTKDAVPDLVVNCRTDDPDSTKAQQCQFLHAATFDVVGHLRQVSAARPRWMLLPRDQDDLCCYPGPGMECPKPIKPCANP